MRHKPIVCLYRQSIHVLRKVEECDSHEVDRVEQEHQNLVAGVKKVSHSPQVHSPFCTSSQPHISTSPPPCIASAAATPSPKVPPQRRSTSSASLLAMSATTCSWPVEGVADAQKSRHRSNAEILALRFEKRWARVVPVLRSHAIEDSIERLAGEFSGQVS